MTPTMTHRWESKRTKESRQVEAVLKQAGFDRVDAYRYNSASIRVRVIDQRFEGLSIEQRYGMVEPVLEQLPERTQAVIISLYTFTQSELHETPKTLRQFMFNTEFDHPSPSRL